jgi:hypothetical protein
MVNILKIRLIGSTPETLVMEIFIKLALNHFKISVIGNTSHGNIHKIRNKSYKNMDGSQIGGGPKL